MVLEITEKVSDGRGGLKKGLVGIMVSVEEEGGRHFHSWAAFLAPVNDMDYSALCSTKEFQASAFYKLHTPATGDANRDRVSRATTRESLQNFLENMVDADGMPVEVPEEVRGELLHIFDECEGREPSVHLYTRHDKLTPRVSANKGQDYSYYYRALNNTLNHDLEDVLSCAMPLIQRMTYLILYHEHDGEKRLHAGGRVWKGDTEAPVPLNMQKLKEARDHGTVIRFRQFQSTTDSKAEAARFKKRDDSVGYLWAIDIPDNFWGARDIRDVAWRKKEGETLFPPYAAFLVKSVDNSECQLQAVDMSHDCSFAVSSLAPHVPKGSPMARYSM